MKRLQRLVTIGWCGLFISTASFAQSAKQPTTVGPPLGDGTTDDTGAIQAALNAAAGSCATVKLQCTRTNTFKVSTTVNIPQCVKLVGECGAVPDEGTKTPVGTTLKWAGGTSSPVVAFHDSPGASLVGVSVDCENQSGAIGIQYDSNDDPPGSFVDVNTLMISGCHQGLVIGLAGNTAASSCSPPLPNPVPTGCAEADQLKFERFRILGNLSDAAAEGIHLNSANGAQGSLISDGNLQGVNIGIHVISTNGGLIVENTNIGSETGANPSFITIEDTVAASPTLFNDEVEAPVGTAVNAVLDHGCNPLGTPGTPVWLNNVWNSHPITLDGSENVTSIGNLSNNATLTTSTACPVAPHVLSLSENGWGVNGAAAVENLAAIANGGATFHASLLGQDVIEAEGPSCPSGKGREFPPGTQHGDLVSCEGQHSGRLWLGQDLLVLNNSAGGLIVEGQLTTHVGVGGSSPTIASGFGASPAIVGTSNAGRVTVGSGGASSGVINFRTAYPNPPICVAQDETNSSAMRAAASTTQLTIAGTMAAADRLTYICLGYQ
jgi:hypothetical protein